MKIKILAIGIAPTNLQSINATLSKFITDTKVTTLLKNETCIKAAQRINPDIILIEIKTPKDNGTEICRLLKADILTQQIPVLFIVNEKIGSDLKKLALDAGCEGFINHPLDETELIAQVRTMAKIKRSHSAEDIKSQKFKKLIDNHTKQLNTELSSRKKTEKALREKKEILKQAQEIAHLGSWEYNLIKNTVNWSDNNYRLFGFKPCEVIPTFQLFTELVYERDKNMVQSVFKNIRQTGKEQEFEYRITTPDDKITWLHTNIVAVFRGKKMVMLKGVNYDITARKLAEKKLEKAMQLASEQEHFSRISAEISTDLINVNLANLNQKIQSALAKTGEYAEADRAVIFLFKENNTLMDNTHEWCAPGAESQIEEYKDIPVSESSWWLGKLIRNKYLNISKNRNNEELTQSVKEILAKQGLTSIVMVPILKGEKFLGFMGLNSSREKNWNEFHVQIIKAIANSVANALFSVGNQKQLLLAKEKAEESDRLKSAFLANMSHEIRTPMNGIMGFLDLMRNGDLTEKEKDLFFDMIKKSSDRLMTTINNIIEIAKIESGQTPVIKSTENVNEIISFLFDTHKIEAERKGLKFKLTESTQKNINKTLAVNTDKIKLEIILKNLIDNAIKFTTKGGIEMGYTVEEDTITFCVKDSGPGIAKDRLNAIFDRFVQADLDITRPYEGAGLGLAITRAYAEMIHGKIWVNSETGKGSEFYLALNHNTIR